MFILHSVNVLFICLASFSSYIILYCSSQDIDTCNKPREATTQYIMINILSNNVLLPLFYLSLLAVHD
jgi:hypothetical protein